MKQYIEMLKYILENGKQKGDRTGTGTLSVFGYQNRYDLSEGFPLVTTKKMFLKGVIHELLWFLRGDTNVKYLNDHGVHIWDDWADEQGNLGLIYGEQWRDFGGVDQIAELITGLKNNPNDRGHIVSAWNVAELSRMALRPCHCLFQFYVQDNTLSCQLYQRSADAFLGVPFNIASYALLTIMIAQVCDMQAGEFIHSFGDLHIYNNHLEQVGIQIARKPYIKPTMRINPTVKDIFAFEYDDFKLDGYVTHGVLKGDISV